MCDGCSECTPACKPWCYTHEKPWQDKCAWAGKCDACSMCPAQAQPVEVQPVEAQPADGASLSMKKKRDKTPVEKIPTNGDSLDFMPDEETCVCWCATSDTALMRRRCKMEALCRGCPQCADLLPKRKQPAQKKCEYKECKKDKKTPWAKKCMMFGKCDGCRQCKEIPLCYNWCSERPKPWENKCTWTGQCDGCPECECNQWCKDHEQPWQEKCTWPQCSTCSKCTPACKPWCLGHDKPWQDKCTWMGTCDACEECSAQPAHGASASMQYIKVNDRQTVSAETRLRVGHVGFASLVALLVLT